MNVNIHTRSVHIALHDMHNMRTSHILIQSQGYDLSRPSRPSHSQQPIRYLVLKAAYYLGPISSASVVTNPCGVPPRKRRMLSGANIHLREFLKSEGLLFLLSCAIN